MRESTSASSGPSWFSPPSSSSTNLFSSYSSTSTRLKRADTVVFDMSVAARASVSDPKRTNQERDRPLSLSQRFFRDSARSQRLPHFLPFPLRRLGVRGHAIAAWWPKRGTAARYVYFPIVATRRRSSLRNMNPVRGRRTLTASIS